MPELPDITVYVEALERRIAGETLIGAYSGAVSPAHIRSPDRRGVRKEGKGDPTCGEADRTWA